MSEQGHVICTVITEVDAELLALALFGLAVRGGPEVYQDVANLARDLGVAEKLRVLAEEYKDYLSRKLAQGGSK